VIGYLILALLLNHAPLQFPDNDCQQDLHCLWLQAADFNGSANSADGLARACRACTNARRRERYRLGVKHPRDQAGSTVVMAALRHGDVKTLDPNLKNGNTEFLDRLAALVEAQPEIASPG
jgi:hypothetical protein